MTGRGKEQERARRKFEWLDQVVTNAALPGLAVRVAVRLAHKHMNDLDECWPSHGTVAADLGASRRGVQLALEQLAAEGHLEIEVHKGRAKGNQPATNRYRMAFPNANSGTHSNANGGAQLDANESAHLNANHSAQDLRTTVRTNQSIEPISGSKEPERGGGVRLRERAPDGALAEHSLEFVRQYPEHDGADDGQKAFMEAVKAGANPADIIAGAMRLAALNPERRSVPYPAVWIRKAGWTQPPKLPAPSRGRSQPMDPVAAMLRNGGH